MFKHVYVNKKQRSNFKLMNTYTQQSSELVFGAVNYSAQ